MKIGYEFYRLIISVCKCWCLYYITDEVGLLSVRWHGNIVCNRKGMWHVKSLAETALSVCFWRT